MFTCTQAYVIELLKTHAGKQADKQADKDVGKQAGEQANKQANKQTSKQADKQYKMFHCKYVRTNKLIVFIYVFFYHTAKRSTL